MYRLSAKAVAYSLDLDADHRKNSLVRRAIFTEPSDSNNNYESKGTITMDTKGKEQCITREIALQVVALSELFC